MKKYGLSSNHYGLHSWRVVEFETQEQIDEWFARTETDEVVCELYDTLEDLVERNYFVREKLDEDMEGDPEEFTTDDYIEALGVEPYSEWRERRV